MVLDGSDVGLSGSSARDIDAFHILPDGTFLLSLHGATSLPDVGSVDDSDIVHFIPTSLGDNTAGSYELVFDGSDVGLSRGDEDIDAIHMLANGDLLVSTSGPFSVPGASGEDEDLLRFTPASLGANTSGAWSLYFDGSDVGLDDSSDEDLWGVWVDEATGELYLTAKGVFSVSGASGDRADVFICAPGSLGNTTSCTFSLFWDGSSHGYAGERLDALAIIP